MAGDGSWAVGLINRGAATASVTLKWEDLKLVGAQVVCDLWRHQDFGVFDRQFSSPVAPHGVVLLRVSPNPAVRVGAPSAAAVNLPL